MTRLLEFNQITRKFGVNAILKGVNFDLFSKEIVALVGNNGSGKSTLLRIAAGLQPPSSGTVQLCEKDIQHMDFSVRSEKITWVSAHTSESPGFSSMQFVALAQERKRFAQGRFAPSEAELQHYMNCLQLFDAEHLAKRDLDKLSTGEWKRVQMARAWVNATPVLLLDEPSNGLDVRHTALLAERIRQYAQHNSAAVLFSSHDFEFVSAIASRIVILHEGLVIFNGAPSDVDRSELEHVFGVPFREGLKPEYAIKA